MDKLGHHTTMDPELRRSVEWLDGRSEVSKIILGDIRPRKHSKTPGTLVVEEKSAGGIALTAYSGVGIRTLFVQTRKQDVLAALIADRWPEKPKGKRGKTTMEAAFEKATNGDAPKVEAAPKPAVKVPVPVPDATPYDEPQTVTKPEDIGTHFSTDVTYALVEYTPETAFDVLTSRNKVNRRIYPVAIAIFKAIIQEDQWDPEAGVIMFDKNGDLINGQHRLTAIVEAGKPVLVRVAYNVDPKTRGNIDTIQRRRTDQDISRMLYNVDRRPVEFGTATRAYLRGGRRVGDQTLLPMQRQEIMAKWQEPVDFAIAAVRHKYKELLSVGLAVIARAYFTADHDKLREFGQVMATGMATDGSHQPIILLRNWLTAGSGSKARQEARNQDVYRKTERALKAFLDGEDLDKLYTVKTEQFPVPADMEDPRLRERDTSE